MRAREAGVAEKGGASRKDLFISRLHVGMGADDGADAPIEHPRKGDLFRRGLGMEVNEDYVCLLSQALDLGERAVKGIVQRRHERAPLEVNNADRWQPVTVKDDAALPWSSRRIIERSNKAALMRQQFHDFLLVPEMIAAGDDIDAGGEDFVGGLDGYAGTAGVIFAVSHDQVHGMLLSQLGKQFLDRAPARLPYDVRDKQNFHPSTVMCDRPPASRFNSYWVSDGGGSPRRSAPVLGRSNVGTRASPNGIGRIGTTGARCARGRAMPLAFEFRKPRQGCHVYSLKYPNHTFLVFQRRGGQHWIGRPNAPTVHPSQPP